ncbi:MAG: MarR family transcriptional regulator [Euryarchaeota archaeon]|nr:MarR family transcriptional regulator [Euryarchaeota archaeon]
MDGRAFGGKAFFAAAIFIASVLVLAFKLLNPTPVQLLVEGDTVIMSQIPGLFTYNDVLIIAVALVFASVSGSYLVLRDSSTVPTTASPASPAPGDVLLEERRQRWEDVSKTLKNDEQKIYKAIIDEGIINQSELVERTGLSKSNVSRALYGLESRGLVERRRRGMGNVVLLK